MRDYEEFLREQAPHLARYAGVLTADHDLAKDLVQEAMVKAHGRWRSIGSLDRPDLYVRRMITNDYISFRRRWATRSITTVANVLDNRHTQLPDHADLLVDRALVRVLLDTLPRRQRAVVVLRFYEQFSHAEIAEILDCSEGTVRSHLSRGLDALRGNLTTSLLAGKEARGQ